MCSRYSLRGEEFLLMLRPGELEIAQSVPPPGCSIEAAQQYTRWLATNHYENFNVASWLLPKELHQHFYNLYAYCRWADDLGDEVPDTQRALGLLNWWEQELDACYEGRPSHPVFVALCDTIVAKDIPRQPFADLLKAFRQDQIVKRYSTWDAVLDYCVYSANPVGRLVLYLCGYHDEPRQKLSDATCTALQLANFWQDVSRDLEKGRIYMFHRSNGLNPNYLISDDDAQTWRYGGKLFVGLTGYSAYVKYANNGKDTIHFVCTEDHPRNYDNSLYHAFICKGNVYASDGKLVGPLATSTNATLRPWDFTRIYQGGSNNVAWMTDIELDSRERPVVLFTVQMNSAGLPRGQGGEDHRFHYARWDGKRWIENEIAYAGKRLYANEDDYTGLGAIDPQDVNVIYISTDADIHTGAPLISPADGKRYHELFRGVTEDNGKNWTWIAVTANSTSDNLRPVVPHGKAARTALVWMRGSYRNNHGEWTTKVVASILKPKDSARPGPD